MNSLKSIVSSTIATIIFFINPQTLLAGDGVEITPGADFVSQYIWRGLMINEAPNIQPSITLNAGRFETGVWGSSTLSKTNKTEDNYAFSHEIDFWMGYGYEFNSGTAIGLLVTDYYFPNAGIEISNFNNYDNENGAGAHTVEASVTLSGPEKLPIGLSAYINIYNDEGKNTYFQFDYSTSIKEVGLDFVIGAAGGSSENPDYYGTDGFNIINIGCTVNKELKITDNFTLPIFVNYMINPLNEVSYLVFGFTL